MNPSIEVAEYERDFGPLADSVVVYPNRRYDYPGPLYQFVRISYSYICVYIYIHTYIQYRHYQYDLLEKCTLVSTNNLYSGPNTNWRGQDCPWIAF